MLDNVVNEYKEKELRHNARLSKKKEKKQPKVIIVDVKI